MPGLLLYSVRVRSVSLLKHGFANQFICPLISLLFNQTDKFL